MYRAVRPACCPVVEHQWVSLVPRPCAFIACSTKFNFSLLSLITKPKPGIKPKASGMTHW